MQSIPPDLLLRLRGYLPYKLYNNLLVYPGVESEAQCAEHLKALLKTVLTYRATPIFEEARPYPDHVQGHWVDATLLFADVSGFTAMSEQLSLRGQAGAEEITQIVNEYFTEMVQVLHRNGGHVLKFGGDALLGMFPGAAETTARYAVQAALDMQRVMIRFENKETSMGTQRLQMKIGLHTGRVFAAHVGTATQMEYWVTGEDVNFTAVAEEAASVAEKVFHRGGQIVASESTRQYLTAWRDWVSSPKDPDEKQPSPPRMPLYLISMTEKFSSLDPRPTTLQGTIPENIVELLDRLDILVPYLPKGVLQRLIYSPDRRRVEGEHRLVAVLFVNVEGFSELAAALDPADTEVLAATMQDYYITMQTVVNQHGGIVNKIDLSSTGDKLLAVFGAPRSHEDDADQAARAALAMQVALEKVNQRLAERCPKVNLRLRQRIGLSTGSVFSGNVGADICQEYTIMGDNVNLAARLMTAAPWGEIWVSDHAHYWLAPFCDFAPVGELTLKGKHDPVPTYRLMAMHTAYRPQPKFVDRAEAREILDRQLMQILSGAQGQIAIITGEPGVGKSRLWAEIKSKAEMQNIRPLSGHCHPYGAMYELFAEMLREYLEVQKSDDLEAQRDKLIRAVADLFGEKQVDQRAPFLAIAMDLPLLEQWESYVNFLGGQLPARIAEEASAFFERVSEDGPLLLVCDDMHHLNQDTAVILLKVIELAEYMPILFGFALYPGVYPIYEEVANKARNRFRFLLQELTLPSLEARHCEEIVNEILGREASPAQQEYIYQLSEGNPLFVVEVARAIYTNPDSRISPTVHKMIESRVDMLPEDVKETLRAAAVIGRQFTLSELLYILDAPPTTIRRDLSTLRGMHLIDQKGSECWFVHTLTHQVIYDGQNVQRRMGYHHRLGNYWERRGSAHKAADYYFACELWGDALRLGEQAALQQYKERYVYPEAIRLYEQTLQAAKELKDLDAQQRLNHQLGEVGYMAGHYEQAVQAFSRELGFLLIQSASTLAQAEVRVALGEVYDRWGDYQQALAELDQGLRLSGSAPNVIRARLLRVRCSTLRSIGEFEKAIESGNEAIAVARNVGSREEEAYANNNLGSVYGEQRQIPSALACHQRALKLRRELGDRYGEEQSLNNVALCHIIMGHVEQAETTFAEALKIQQEIGDRVGEGSTHHSLGRIDCMKGQLGAAEAKFQQALEIWGRIDYRKGMAFVHHDLGADVYVAQSRWGEARKHLEEAIKAYEEMGIKPYLPEAYLAIAPVYRALGLMSEALMAEQKARDNAPKDESPYVEEGVR